MAKLVYNSYITIIPRGLELTTCKIIEEEIKSQGYDCANVKILDTLYHHDNNISAATALAPTSSSSPGVIINKDKVQDYKTKLYHQQLLRKERIERYRKNKNVVHEPSPDSCIDNACTSTSYKPASATKEDEIQLPSLLHGSIQVNENGHKHEINIGYHNDKTIISMPGGLEGKCILNFQTNAPAIVVSKIRPMGCGPLLALVMTSRIDDESQYTDKDNIILKSSVFDTKKTLDEAVESFTEHINEFGTSKYKDAFQTALGLWYQHVREVWLNSNHVREYLKTQTDVYENQFDVEKLHQALLEKMDGRQTCYHRVSCMRSYSKEFSYKRDDIIPRLVNHLIPKEVVIETNPKPLTLVVDLKNYDFEVVLFIHDGIVTVAISLRPYQYLGARSYSSGKIPPDILQPYLTGEIVNSLVRLRPSIASLLFYVSNIEKGSIVLDPCAGIGSIPIEASLLNKSKTSFGLGGDIAICGTNDNEGLENVIAHYANEAQEYQRTECDGGGFDMISWDASSIPIRQGSIDYIISDLPFGVKCMSAKRLQTFLPLLFSECARVLRPSGRMTLLCGSSYKYVLDALAAQSCDISEEEGKPSSQYLFQVDSVFPVNISGLAGWIIQAKRNDHALVRIKNYKARLLKMAASRDQQQRQGMKRRLQS